MFGNIIIHGIMMPITRMWMDGGQLHIQGNLRGPTSALDGTVSIRGTDGQLVIIGGPHVKLPPLAAQQVFLLELHLDLETTACAPAVIQP